MNTIKRIGDDHRLEAIYVHVGLDDKILRISNAKLAEWLREKGYSKHIVMDGLAKEFGMTRVIGRMGAGCGPHIAGATEYLLQIDLAGSPLADFIDEA